MSDQNSTTSRISLPDQANYDILYADAITRLSAALAEDERKAWSFVNADGPATGDILTVMAGRITLLKESFFQLKRTFNNLLLVARVWMNDASKHTQKQLEEERQKYKKLRSDRDVPAHEERALERLKDIRNAINNDVTEYNDQYATSQWKWPEILRNRLSPLGPLSKLEKAVQERRNADQSDEPDNNADVKLQGPQSCVARDSTDAASDQPDQPDTVADVYLQSFFTESDKARGSPNTAPDQSDHSRIVADANFQDMFIDSDEAKEVDPAQPWTSTTSLVLWQTKPFKTPSLKRAKTEVQPMQPRNNKTSLMLWQK